MKLKYWMGCFLLLGSLGLSLGSCADENVEPDIWTRPAELAVVDTLIREGVMLESVQSSPAGYELSFEKGRKVVLPVGQVKQVQEEEELWKTVITLANGEVYNIPSLGTSIAGFIKEVKVNPSGYCPLAASVKLVLPAKGRFKVNVKAKEGAVTPDQAHLYPFSENYEQEVAVLGLYENYENQVELTFMDSEGNPRGETVTLEIPVKKLEIGRLPNNKVVVCQPDRMEQGMTLVACPGKSDTDTSIPYMIDADGELRWVLDWSTHPQLNHIGAHCSLHRMQNGNYVTGDVNNGQIVEVDPLGNLIHRWGTDEYGFVYHHEASQAPDGKLLVAVTKNDARTADGTNSRILDHIAELDPVSGGLLNLWDLTAILDSSRIVFTTLPNGYPANTKLQDASNWCHNNGVIGMRDGSILITSRWQGLVKFTRQGKLRWVIGPHNNWKEEYRKYLLTPLDKNGNRITDPAVLNGTKEHPDFNWGWGIHCPVELPNGHVMLFDNGYSRLFSPQAGESYSRAVEYEVDEAEMTVRQVWEYGRERGSSCFSSQVSGVQYLEKTGNRLFCPGIGNKLSDGFGGRVIEIDAKNGAVVFEMEVKSSGSPAFHRANRLPLYPD